MSLKTESHRSPDRPFTTILKHADSFDYYSVISHRYFPLKMTLKFHQRRISTVRRHLQKSSEKKAESEL